ncbi:MAG: chemotaxis protein CheC [Rhodospirillales bacterium]|nr:chemotaxis protein CheC [Rhodospirillales bacterium]
MIELSAAQRDAICEILNIAVGYSAASLNAMVGEEVSLSVPAVDVLTHDEAIERLSSGDAKKIAVKQRFQGHFSGKVLLIFPERRSLDLVRSITRDAVPLGNLTELEQEALMEVGNIILNAYLGSIANQLGKSLESSLPIYLTGEVASFFGEATQSRDGTLVFFLQVDFALRQKKIFGYVVIVMDLDSAHSFRNIVDEHVAAMCA